MWLLGIKIPRQKKKKDLFNWCTQAQRHSSKSCWNFGEVTTVYCDKVPNAKMVTQVRPCQDHKAQKMFLFGVLEMGIFLLLLKANQPFHSNITLQTPMKFALCHVPLDFFLASLISRFWNPLEDLCFSLISTVAFHFFLSGILASWGWSIFLTYSPYVCFRDLGGHSPSPHFIILR